MLRNVSTITTDRHYYFGTNAIFDQGYITYNQQLKNLSWCKKFNFSVKPDFIAGMYFR
jgi:hypothetical protein